MTNLGSRAPNLQHLSPQSNIEGISEIIYILEYNI